MMDVSVIIVNYNTKDLTKNCIDSVFKWTKGVSFEVILVDNASKDGSKELFEKDNRINYVYNNENLGFGRANNIGASISKGNWLFFLNSDTYLLNDAISQLYNRANNSGKDVACLGCIMLDCNKMVTHSYGMFPSKLRMLGNYTVLPLLSRLKIIKKIESSSNYNYEYLKGSGFFDVDYITGADLMLNSEVARILGMFDEDFFMYFEETEMQYRYACHGYRRIVVEGPQIIHLEGKSLQRQSIKKKTMKLSSYFKYVRKTNSMLTSFVYLLIFKFVYLLIGLICLPFIHGGMKEKISHLAISTTL